MGNDSNKENHVYDGTSIYDYTCTDDSLNSRVNTDM